MITKRAQPDSSMRLLVELRHIEPRIWRRLVVPARVPLDVLHAMLQLAFGWQDSHLHDFEVGQIRFGVPDVDDRLLVDERAAPLGAVARSGSRFVYRYDFGDDWDHDITVEAIDDPHGGPLRVECVDGARACPPEDCGGPPGYENLLRVLADPNDEEHAALKRWVGRGFDPEKLDLEKLNKTLGKKLERALRGR